jgi:hypothetical protein
MSGHVRDRLSAYLDQELVPAERTAVETHLQGCDACRQHLETLAAVDAAARALPVVAPARYFDALPGRVRARLERPAPRVRHLPLRLPAWTWAAAAVLVLGMVTPLTMISLWSSREEPLPATRPAERPLSGVGGAAVADATPRPERPREVGRPEVAGVEKEEAKASTSNDLKLRQTAPGPARDALASAPPAAPVENAPASEAPTFAAAPLSAPGREGPHGTQGVRARRPEPGGPHAQQQAQTQAQAAGGLSAGNVASASRADEPAAAEAETAARRSEQPAPPAGRALAKSARERDGAGLREEVVLSNEARAASPEGAEYQRLLVAPAQSVDALRARREAWRAYALRFPESRYADEARVRVVETGAAAWRLGQDPNDWARVREDAAAYLDRKDSAQAARVRAILQKVEEP